MSAWRYVVVVWVASRAFFLTIGAVAAAVFEDADPAGRQFEPLGPLEYWARWDGAWYASIAVDGYAAHAPDAANFFPVYPLAMRPLTWLGDIAALAGVAISVAALLAALFFVYRIADAEWGREVARASTLALAFFPTAFYFNAVYSEALFIALAAGSVWAARVANDGVLSGVLGGCAAATRNVGALLAVPLAYEWSRRRMRWREALLGVALIVWGLAAYMLYLWRAFGDPLLFAHLAEEVWRRELANPLTTMVEGARAAREGLDVAIRPHEVLQTTSLNPPFELANVTNFLVLVLAVALLVGGAFKLPRGLAAYAVLAVAAPVLVRDPAYPLIGLPRYVLAAFPLFFVVGMLLARRLAFRIAYVAVSGVVGAYLTALFVTWRWVA